MRAATAIQPRNYLAAVTCNNAQSVRFGPGTVPLWHQRRLAICQCAENQNQNTIIPNEAQCHVALQCVLGWIPCCYVYCFAKKVPVGIITFSRELGINIETQYRREA